MEKVDEIGFFSKSIIFAILWNTSNNINNPIATVMFFEVFVRAPTKLNFFFFYDW